MNIIDICKRIRSLIKSKQAIRRNFLEKEFLVIGPAGTIIRTEFFNAIGRFPEDYGPAGDMLYNIKAALHSDVLLLPYVFFNYRRHAGQEINKKYSYLFNNYRYLQEVMRWQNLPLSNEERTQLITRGNRNFLEQAVMHIKHTGEVIPVLKAFKLAGFGPKQFWSGLLIKPER